MLQEVNTSVTAEIHRFTHRPGGFLRKLRAWQT